MVNICQPSKITKETKKNKSDINQFSQKQPTAHGKMLVKNYFCKNCFSIFHKKSALNEHLKNCQQNTDVDSVWSKVFAFEDEFFDSTLVDSEVPCNNFLRELVDSCQTDTTVCNMKLLHLNVNSLFLKRFEIMQILELELFDLICLNETKLDEFIPNSFLSHNSYNSFRRDRNGCGGGVLVFVNKSIKVTSSQVYRDYEAISIEIFCNNTTANFLC